MFWQEEPDLRERRLLDLLKDYDNSILYHLGKANVVVDSLIRLSMGSTSHVEENKKEFEKDVHKLARVRVWLMDFIKGRVVVMNEAQSSLKSEVKEMQHQDPNFL